MNGYKKTMNLLWKSILMIILIFILVSLIVTYIILFRRYNNRVKEASSANYKNTLIPRPLGQLTLKDDVTIPWSDLRKCTMTNPEQPGIDEVFVQYAVSQVDSKNTGKESDLVYSDIYKIMSDPGIPSLKDLKYGLFLQIENQQGGIGYTFNLYRRYSTTNFINNPSKSSFTLIQSGIPNYSPSDIYVYFYDIANISDIPNFCAK